MMVGEHMSPRSSPGYATACKLQLRINIFDNPSKIRIVIDFIL